MIARTLHFALARSLRSAAWICAHIGFERPFVHVLSRGLSGPPSTRGTILALQPERFRGDLDVLAAAGFTIIRLPFEWQARLITLFCTLEKADGANASGKLAVRWHGSSREALARFLGRLIPALYRKLGIDITLSAGVHYWRDTPWGIASTESGYPYVVAQRENLISTEAQRRFYLDWYGGFEPFAGDRVVVHNTTMARVLTESGFAKPDQVAVVGAVRMDQYLQRVEEHRTCGHADDGRKLALFFSFTEGSGLPTLRSNWSTDERGWVELFRTAHVCFAHLARERPDVDFRIKLKWGGHYLEKIEALLNAAGLPLKAIPNLTISDEGNPHDLILSSSVVMGFNTTALLEAAIAGKPVVVPCFAEAASDEYAPFVHFSERRDLFSFVSDAERLGDTLLGALEGGNVSDEIMQARRALFEEFVSSAQPVAAGKLTALIDSLVRQSRERRAARA